MPVISRIEQVKTEIVTEYQGVTQANGYRNTPTVVKVINPIPDRARLPVGGEVGIEVGNIRALPRNSSWTTFDIDCDVWVQGTVKSDTDTDNEATNLILAAESLRHDLLRKSLEMLNKYLTHTGSKWLITTRYPIQFSAIQLLGKDRNVGAFYGKFTVCIKNMTNNLLFSVSGGVDGPSAGVVIDGGTV